MKKNRCSHNSVGQTLRWWYSCAVVSLVVIYVQGMPARFQLLEDVRLIRQNNKEYLELKKLDREALGARFKSLEVKKSELDRREFVMNCRKYHIEQMGRLVSSIEEFPVRSGNHMVVVGTDDGSDSRRLRCFVPHGKHILKFSSTVKKMEPGARRAKQFGSPLLKDLALPENTAIEFQSDVVPFEDSFSINIKVVTDQGETIFEHQRDIEGQYDFDSFWKSDRSADLAFRPNEYIPGNRICRFSTTYSCTDSLLENKFAHDLLLRIESPNSKLFTATHQAHHIPTFLRRRWKSFEFAFEPRNDAGRYLVKPKAEPAILKHHASRWNW